MIATPTPTITFSSDQPWLAPLAGYSDLTFRLLCREQGAGVACTEMVSAKGLVYGLERKKKTACGSETLLATTPQDTPLVVQLFGAETPFLERAMETLVEWGYQWFDLNMGCSVPKVNKTGAGSAMLKDIPNALNVAQAMIKKAPPGRVGFKIRLGWSAPDVVYPDLAKALEQLGAGWVTLHPRFARQGFSGTADWSALARLAREVSIPVIASGDLFTARDGARCIAETGVSTVMFARGAIANPAIFRQYLECMKAAGHAEGQNGSPQAPPLPAGCGPAPGGELSPGDLLALIRRHAELARKWVKGKPDKRGLEPALIAMRTTTPRYVKHLPGVRHLRHDLSLCATWEEFDAILQDFFLNGEKELP